VLNILLQILDDGRLTDSQGRTINFKNTIIIMTSNIGARLITDKKTLGFTTLSENDLENDYEETRKQVLQELKKEFRPEFINRIDELIVFHKLSIQEIKDIADIILKQISERLKEKEITISIDENVKDLIVEKGTDSNYGARPLKRTIQSMIEDKIAEEIIAGNIKEGDKIRLTEDKGVIVVEN